MSCGMSIDKKLINQLFLIEVREELSSMENVDEFMLISRVCWFCWRGGVKENEGSPMLFCLLLSEEEGLIIGYEQKYFTGLMY